MKKMIDMFNNRRRGFTDNTQGIVIMTVIFLLILIVGGIALLFVLSKIIVPLIILIVVVIVASVVIKWVFGVKTTKYIGKGVEYAGGRAMGYGQKGIRSGATWFGKLIGGS